jgi:uncharacterized protein (TIGR02453 family)
MGKTIIKKETLQFLKDLKKNNDREWFAKNKHKFIAANENFIEFTQEIISHIAKFDKSVAGMNAKDCIFRIYRDTRFSKDKSPYKTNFGAAFKMGKGDRANGAGYYFHLMPGGSFLAGGIHLPESPVLKALRQEISYNGKGFLKVINDKKFKKLFKLDAEKLSRVPQGFDKEDEMGEFLKMKEFICLHSLSEDDVLCSGAAEKMSKVFKEMVPFNDFLNKAL